jgi:hypothetical protein
MKNIEDLSSAEQKIVRSLNLMKNNINLANEILDVVVDKSEIKENEIL